MQTCSLKDARLDINNTHGVKVKYISANVVRINYTVLFVYAFDRHYLNLQRIFWQCFLSTCSLYLIWSANKTLCHLRYRNIQLPSYFLQWGSAVRTLVCLFVSFLIYPPHGFLFLINNLSWLEFEETVQLFHLHDYNGLKRTATPRVKKRGQGFNHISDVHSYTVCAWGSEKYYLNHFKSVQLSCRVCACG